MTEFTVEGAWEGLRSRWILIDNKTGKRIEHCFVQRLYSAAELRKLMLGCGFESVEINEQKQCVAFVLLLLFSLSHAGFFTTHELQNNNEIS